MAEKMTSKSDINGKLLRLTVYVLSLLLLWSIMTRLVRQSQADEIREACTSDAVAHCPMTALLAAAAGDRRGIDRCFAERHREFSRHCQAVLARHKR